MWPGGFILGSVYFHTGEGAAAKNATLLAELLKLVGSWSSPWLLGVDGNQPPTTFAESGWLDKTKSTIAATGLPTFNKLDQHSEIDFFILSAGLDQFVKGVRLISNAPCSPHSFQITFGDLDWHAEVHSAVEWQRFPTAMPIGPRRHPEDWEPKDQDFSWAVGDRNLNLQQAAQEWVAAAE